MNRIKSDPKVTYTFYHGIWSGLDLLFPPVCGGCEKPGSRWCLDCQNHVEVLNNSVCEVCGLPQEKEGVCDACQTNRPPYRALRSWSVFEHPVRNALHRLKYRNDLGLGDALASQLKDFVYDLNWPIDMIVPIPLGKQRMKERGYNQVGLVARPMALAMNIEYAPKALSRQRETRSQVGLTRLQRQENVQNAFKSDRELVAGKTVLVMDDVATTGSTLSSSSEALLSCGAREVYALTVARALPQHMGHA